MITVGVTVRYPKSLLEKIDKKAEGKDYNRSEFIRETMRRAVNEKP